MENRKSEINIKYERFVITGVILLLTYLVLSQLVNFFAAFLGALMFYILSKPLNKWLLNKKKLSKSVSASIIIVISLIFISLPLAFFIGLMYHKVSVLLQNPDAIDNTLKSLNTMIQNKYHVSILNQDSLNSIKANTKKYLPMLLNKSVSAISTLIMLCFFLYFMIISTGKMEASIIKYLPFTETDVIFLGKEMEEQTISNSLSIPLIIIAQSIASIIAYEIIGLPQGWFWGVITGVCSVLPVVGAAIVWAPVAVYMFTNGSNWQGIFTLLYGLLVLSTLDNIVRFLLAKKVANVHPVITVLGVIVGVQFFGPLGLIFGPLIISYLLSIVRIYYKQYIAPDEAKKEVHNYGNIT